MEELNLEPTYSRKTSSSAISAVGSDYEIESIFGVGGSEMYVNLYTAALLKCLSILLYNLDISDTMLTFVEKKFWGFIMHYLFIDDLG